MVVVGGVRRAVVVVAVVLALAGCVDPDSAPAVGSSSAPSTADLDQVFTDTMETVAPGWQQDFAVEGATVDDAPTLAILTAQTACTNLQTKTVEEVLLTLLSGALPADTAGSVLYAATVAYCPDYTNAVQAYADTNR